MPSLKKGLFLLLLSSLFWACGNKNKPQPKTSAQQTVADKIEEASFTTLEGKKISVSDFEGKVVLINFWETWCEYCISSFPALQKLQKEYKNSFVVLAVTPGFSDSKKDARAFKKSHDYNFIYAMDTNNLHRILKIAGLPYKVVVSAKGKFVEIVRGTAGPRQDYKKLKTIVEKYIGKNKRET